MLGKMDKIFSAMTCDKIIRHLKIVQHLKMTNLRKIVNYLKLLHNKNLKVVNILKF